MRPEAKFATVVFFENAKDAMEFGYRQTMEMNPLVLGWGVRQIVDGELSGMKAEANRE